MPNLLDLARENPEVALAAAASLALTVGFVLGFLARPVRRDVIEALEVETGRLEAQAREQARMISRLRADQRGLANLSRFLPATIRDLNRSELDPRQVPDLLVSLVNAIFEPAQIALYLVRSPGEPSERELELYLAGQRGLPESASLPKRIRVGDGKIGWIAETKVEMLADDWLDFTKTEGRSIPDSHPALRLDLVGPIVHHERGVDRLYGVLAIGAPSVRPRDEKLMLQMITNLAALAMVNARNYRRLREQANRDGLTGLFNRRYFLQDRLGDLVVEAEREGRRLGVFLFDIDHFKHYNDTNGHVAGDDALRLVGRVVRENLRPTDVACRYGGEEFVIALPEERPGEALQAAERLRAAIEQQSFPHGSSQPGGRLTISGGVAVLPTDARGSLDLVQRADEALYRAKRTGRNRILAFHGIAMGDEPPPPDWLPQPDAPARE